MKKGKPSKWVNTPAPVLRTCDGCFSFSRQKLSLYFYLYGSGTLTMKELYHTNWSDNNFAYSTSHCGVCGAYGVVNYNKSIYKSVKMCC